MQTAIGLPTLPGGPHPPYLRIQDHPVFQALPPDAQYQAMTNCAFRLLTPDKDVPDDGGLYFILNGMLGLFPGDQRICVSAVVAGSVHGWDQALYPTAPRTSARALIETQTYRIPAQCVLESLGREWLTRLVALQAQTRLHFLATEAACNASHLVTERLAKWLVRLYCGVNGAPLRLTQSDFGALLGVQRTSVNGAAGRLQEQGLVRFGRGKVQVVDLAGLRAASCGCGEKATTRTVALYAPSCPPRVESASWASAGNIGLVSCRSEAGVIS